MKILYKLKCSLLCVFNESYFPEQRDNCVKTGLQSQDHLVLVIVKHGLRQAA